MSPTEWPTGREKGHAQATFYVQTINTKCDRPAGGRTRTTAVTDRYRAQRRWRRRRQRHCCTVAAGRPSRPAGPPGHIRTAATASGRCRRRQAGRRPTIYHTIAILAAVRPSVRPSVVKVDKLTTSAACSYRHDVTASRCCWSNSCSLPV